jgi:prolyl-tRNA editing enzyme YbaK/EbsC (Cys-tRNA(Pro) deacylase)
VPDPQSHPAITRVLDAAARKGVTLDVIVFDDSTHTAEDAAHRVGAELGQIVKSLVFVASGEDGPEPILCLVSGANRVDIARLAAVTGEPTVRRATAREATELTGFTIGGIPPIGHSQPVRVVMDPDLGRYETVWAAAGTPTAVFPVPPASLRMLANAHVAPIVESSEPVQSAESAQSGESTESTQSTEGRDAATADGRDAAGSQDAGASQDTVVGDPTRPGLPA